MDSGSFEIVGGDYEHGGSASSGLKDRLKKVGASPSEVRRAMIAAYEAEMNVIIHAYRGVMRFTLEPGWLDVEVIDEGPGIPDIDRAMEEGFSTAPPRARELGFGAGLGLPNIRKNSDRFEIESTVGQGTQVRFAILLTSQAAVSAPRHSLRVVGEACCGCLECLHVCPTRALRLRGGRPVVLEHLCVDCGACIKVCPTDAIAVATPVDFSKPSEEVVLVLPASLLVQFGPGVSLPRVFAAFTELGFPQVRILDEWSDALRAAVLAYVREETACRPVISPACGAVVNLIQTRFPSLIEHVAPFVSPVEAALEDLSGHPAVFAVACPYQQTVVTAQGGASGSRTLHPVGLRREVAPLVNASSPGAEMRPEVGPISAASSDDVLTIGGIRHVLSILEMAENGLLTDVEVLEPFACEAGCFGSPLFTEDAFVARHRWRGAIPRSGLPARAIRRRQALSARPGVRLDSDMGQAIRKLSQIDVLVRGLPGRNCGVCGSPTCLALAEDIVLGRAGNAVCPYAQQPPETPT